MSQPLNLSNNNKATRNQQNQALSKAKEHLASKDDLEKNLKRVKHQHDQNLNPFVGIQQKQLRPGTVPVYFELGSGKKIKPLKYGEVMVRREDNRPDFFFGCIFHFVENKARLSYGEKCLEYGGIIVDHLSNCVTHLICPDQTYVSMVQSTNMSIKCATDSWLKDVLFNRRLIAPWLFHHFPTSHRKNESPLMGSHITITNFDDPEIEEIVIIMLTRMGVTVVRHETSWSTYVVLSPTLDGPFVRQAKENFLIFNTNWLVDVYFGLFNDFATKLLRRHRVFKPRTLLQTDFSLIPQSLLDPWNIVVRQVRRLTASECGPSEPERQRTETVNTEISGFPSSRPIVLFIGFSVEEEEEYKMYVLQLGGIVSDYEHGGTHLVVKNQNTTLQFLMCLSSLKWVVDDLWLRHSYTSQRFLSEQTYCIPYVFEGLHSTIWNISNILKSPNRRDLFKGLFFYVCPTIQSMPAAALSRMLILAGGIPVRQINEPNLNSSNNFIIVTDDMASVKNIQHGIVVKSDFVIRSIMEQRCLPIEK